MPEVIWLSGGIDVPTGVVGTGEAEPVEAEDAAEPVPVPDAEVVEEPDAEDGADVVEAACLFARRA
jgi:hypothetical protein